MLTSTPKSKLNTMKDIVWFIKTHARKNILWFPNKCMIENIPKFKGKNNANSDGLVIRKMSIYALVLVQYGMEIFVSNDPKKFHIMNSFFKKKIV
jgi:hypothetical protein